MHTSIIIPIIKAFKIVPIPGFCFNGSQSNKTAILIKIVIRPIEKPIFKNIPCASTLHGDAPDAETINIPSPKPNKIKPKQRKKKVEIFGFKFNDLSELQETLGIFLICRNIFNKILLLLSKSIKLISNEKVFITYISFCIPIQQYG